MPCRKKLQALSRFKPTWERNSAYDELDDIIGKRCAALVNERDAIKGRAGFHWWPKIAKPK